MVHITSTIVALKTVTLILGGLITYFAFKAYRRTGSPPLRALGLGFGAVTLGSLLAGVVDRLLETAGTSALVVESALTAVGFAIILYSLYAD
jgi:O-antigen/teichoic acid export membrane protein